MKTATKHFSTYAMKNAYRDWRHKGRDRLVLMPIKTFLYLAMPIRRPLLEKLARIATALHRGIRLTDIPYLQLRWRNRNKSDTALRVIGHEGRHRAMVLDALGYTHMPVILEAPFRWSEQQTVGFDYSERWPTKIIPEDRPRAKPVFWQIPREHAGGRWRAVRHNPRKANARCLPRSY